MRKTASKKALLKNMASIYNSDDLVPISYKRNGCSYRWGIPFKNYQDFEKLGKPYSIDSLLSLGGKLLNILVFHKSSLEINSSKTGVQQLDVYVMSSESEDRQLLHKLSGELRAKDKPFNRDNIPGTNINDE